MDGARFDAVVQSLAQHSTRRTAVTLSLSGALVSLGLFATDAKKKKKKKCKKKKCPPPCRKCKKGKCKPTGEGLACGPCSECQGGSCVSLCAAGEQCLDNDSCAKTCENDAQCAMATCACNAEDGGEPVCRIPVGIDPTCNELATCESTADCPQGSVCSTTITCDPTRCVPLCDVSE
jgi:hypothetical protein